MEGAEGVGGGGGGGVMEGVRKGVRGSQWTEERAQRVAGRRASGGGGEGCTPG